MLRSVFDSHKRMRDMLLFYSEALLDQTVQSLICMAFHTAEARLCRWILMAGDQVQADELPLTQEFLAQMLGVQRSTVSLTAHALQAAGLIRYRRGNITVLDRDGVEESSCECYRISRDRFDRSYPSS